MASQQPPPPPVRPWLRLASIRPPPPPNSTNSNPQPEPVLAPVRPVIRPAFSQPFRPPPPPPPQQLPLNPISPPPQPPPQPQQLPLNPVSPPQPQQPLNPISPPSPPPPRQQLPLNPISQPSRTSPPPPASPRSPDIKTSSPPNVSSPSPPPPPAVRTSVLTATTRSPNPPSSPSPSPSPKIRHISHPPSPLTLPPAQLNTTEPQFKIPQEPEQKTVLVQQTTEKSKLTNGTSSNTTHHRNVNGLTRSQPKMTKEDNKGIYKKYSDSEDYGMRIITIAGENKGAVMELNPLKKNNDNKNISQAWNSDGENSKKGYNNDYKPPSSYVNSNVQGINNSIIFNASCTHHDPGVHLSVSRNGNGGRHAKEKIFKD